MDIWSLSGIFGTFFGFIFWLNLDWLYLCLQCKEFYCDEACIIISPCLQYSLNTSLAFCTLRVIWHFSTVFSTLDIDLKTVKHDWNSKFSELTSNLQLLKNTSVCVWVRNFSKKCEGIVIKFNHMNHICTSTTTIFKLLKTKTG